MEHQSEPSAEVTVPGNYTPQLLQEYLEKKHRGGTSAQKGQRYEDYFAVYRIALHAAAYLDTGTDPNITTQRKNFFVDDLVIENSGTNELNCCQLRNVKELTWGNGKPGSLRFDFLQQQKATHGQTELRLELVNSGKELCEKMRNQTPVEISETTGVTWFPDARNLTFWDVGEVRTALSAICSSSNLVRDKIEALGKLILGEWINAPQSTTIAAIFQSLRPHGLIRASAGQADQQIRSSVKIILDQIEGFKYSTDRGFFHYDYLGTTGTLRFDCFSNNFNTAQDWIEKHQPTEFEGQLERMLMTWTLE